jgi:Transposase DDE domain group 1
VLAATLRPGNAGANNAADHLDLVELALEQLPREALDGPILARSDSAAPATRWPTRAPKPAVRFSFVYAINERVREAILALPEAAWRPAIEGDNQPRDGAWVAELADHLALDAWPEGLPLIVRRERPHPGAQTPARDDEEERKVRLLLLGKAAVLAHRYERPLAAEMDEDQQSWRAARHHRDARLR